MYQGPGRKDGMGEIYIPSSLVFGKGLRGRLLLNKDKNKKINTKIYIPSPLVFGKGLRGR